MIDRFPLLKDNLPHLRDGVALIIMTGVGSFSVLGNVGANVITKIKSLGQINE